MSFQIPRIKRMILSNRSISNTSYSKLGIGSRLMLISFKNTMLVPLLLFHTCIVITLAGCKNQPATPIETVPDVPESVTVNAHLKFGRESYYVGETLALDIKISNGLNTPVKFDNLQLDIDSFAFSSPQKIYLKSPKGEDLLRVYDQNELFESSIVIEPLSDETFIVVPWVVLQEPGSYTFGIELETSDGHVYQSNDIDFNVEDEESSISPESVEVILQPEEMSFTVSDAWFVDIAFSNHSDSSLIFFYPQAGSHYGWINPAYIFLAYDDLGRSLAIPGGDFTKNPVYDESTQFILQPGETHHVRDQIPRFAGMYNPGVYKLQLMYIVRKNVVSVHILSERANWDENVFVGVRKSNTVTVTITASE